MADDIQPGLPRLSPLPYHEAIVRLLKTEEPAVWQWACSAQAREEHADAVRSDLLKETYRLDLDAHPGLHKRCATGAERIGLNVLLYTLHQ